MVVRSIRVACPDNTAEVNDVPEDGATTSGLLALGDGAWQANWKTSSTWAGTCRRMDLVLDDGVTAGRSALFIFRG